MLNSVLRYLGFFLHRTLAVIEISSVDFQSRLKASWICRNVSDWKW